jgi:site-specific DNA-methyltransferase (adenine-specific)
MKNQVILGDCLEVMKDIPDKSIDMILADLPYGTTACSWDTIIPFEPLWKQYKRIIKDNGAIVLTASQPFTSALVMSNPDMFKYEWIWEKAVGSNFATLKYMPMKEHENILVFGKGRTIYNPQMQERKGSGKVRSMYTYKSNTISGDAISNMVTNRSGEKYDENKRNPSSVQFFNNREDTRGLHPTQKPVALFEYLIKTYTNEGDLVLDNCAGSGTTGVACKNLNRNYILIEKEKRYIDIIQKRLDYVVKG